MGTVKKLSLHKLAKHNRKYINLSGNSGGLVTTRQNQPKQMLPAIKSNTIHSLKSILKNVRIQGSINDSILPDYTLW